MAQVHFIQHLHTLLDPLDVWIERPEDVAIKARYIESHSFRLECEVLDCGDISLFITSGPDDTTYAMRISHPRARDLLSSVDTLILEFDTAKAVRQRSWLEHEPS